jgi:NADH:ubiquinone oxidoreductase subunit 5 (subunit L)/multisubunit Na+/H+ antiporter MnhA subunit
VALVMPIAMSMLALASGLTAACFVKAFGITFLAMPRSREAAQAHEAPLSMQTGMAALVVACVGLGLAPFVVVPMLGAALSGFGGLATTGVVFTLELPLRVPGTHGEMSLPLLALLLLLVLGLVLLGLRTLGADGRLRVGDTWGCGRIGQTPRMAYTATAFAEPLRRIFAELFRPTQNLSIDFHPESKYFVQSIEYRSEIHPWFERLLYAPLFSLLRAVAGQVRRLQAGSLHLYLLYMTVALLALLVATRWGR